MDDLYYIEFEGQQYGPYDISTVRGLPLSPSTLIKAGAYGDWREAASYPEIAPYITTEDSTANEADYIDDNINIPVFGSTYTHSSNSTNDLYSITYYYRDDSGVYGPFSIVELAHLLIEEDSIIGINGYGDDCWHYAKDIDGLLDVLNYIISQNNSKQTSTMEDDEPQREDVQNHEDSSEDKINYDDLLHTIIQQEEVIRNLRSKIDNQTEPITKTSIIKVIKEYKQNAQEAIANHERLKKLYARGNSTAIDIDFYNDSKEKFLSFVVMTSIMTEILIKDSSIDSRSKNEILTAFHDAHSIFNKINTHVASKAYETAACDSSAWTELQPSDRKYPSEIFYIGSKTINIPICGEIVSFSLNRYDTILNHKNIVAYYDGESKSNCFDVINTFTARLFMSSIAGKLFVSSVDAQEMNGISEHFKRLNKSVFFFSSENKIQECLSKKLQNIENIIQNQLIGDVSNIGEYNALHETPEKYELIIIKAFPVGLSASALNSLKQVMKNGPRAGIHTILLIDKDELQSGDDHFKKVLSEFKLPLFEKDLITMDFTEEDMPEDYIQFFKYDILTSEQQRQVVHKINSLLEDRTPDIVSFANFIPRRENWWQGRSANMVEIPFGVSENKELTTLSITQQSGQNSAVVVGIPGSGKSVFLHSIICNAAMKYSPEELELYLMDFSGVEFNTYAEHKLPHAKVIAPEAEREFGLSILNRLKEEGERRMALCRNYSTAKNKISSIVELKYLHPELHCPRILVIIDEFQKLFENENDNTSRQAQVIIQIIIKEFRKFGINLILATQKLSDLSNSLLPRDLIANRIVFRCSPTDLPLIGESAMPLLNTGECVYNAESGIKEANNKVHTFYIDNNSLDSILTDLYTHAENTGQIQKDAIIFCSSDLPDFRSRRPTTKPQSAPASIIVHIGEPIAISPTDVCASITQTSNDNILIIGGEPSVAEATAYFVKNSVISQYSDFAAKFYFFNFLRNEINPLSNVINDTFRLDNIFEYTFANRQDEVIGALQEIKTEIEARIADECKVQKHIWLSIYGFQYAQAFKLGGRRGDSVSEAGQILRFILSNGPLVGVFTVLQVDNESNLRQLESGVINFFEHRVVFQMDESGSNRIIGSDAASRLYVINRPSSVYRGYYYNNHNRIFNKFKPYCMQNGNMQIPFLLNQ